VDVTLKIQTHGDAPALFVYVGETCWEGPIYDVREAEKKRQRAADAVREVVLPGAVWDTIRRLVEESPVADVHHSMFLDALEASS
jgi:hypothetical protein